MSRADDITAHRRAVVHEVIAAFSPPGEVNPGLATLVLANAAEILGESASGSIDPSRRRMPTLMDRRAAAFDEPDPPPVPPAAL
ncbi:hypothetical protein EDF43_1113 [Rathayibacter sp. PhB179]|nr:hypothetical protein EDF49_111192 [Rathayibacter sp. PhB192]TCM25175.1 hypothetical protein EDF43_1113 [Rathayibacter sp. PhB179]